jgi:hypothetical protein
MTQKNLFDQPRDLAPALVPRILENSGAQMPSKKSKTNTEAKYAARFCPILFERIKERAHLNNRSINQELAHGMGQYLNALEELELLIALVKRQSIAAKSALEYPA